MTAAPNSTRHAARDARGRFRRDVNAEIVAELHERLRAETSRFGWVEFAIVAAFIIPLIGYTIYAAVIG